MTRSLCFVLSTATAFLAACGPSKPPEPPDPKPAARAACKQFIERSGYRVQDWGQSWEWTTVQNGDGTWSVGARFMGAAPGGVSRNLYVTCVMGNSGDNWSLQSLSRM